MTDTRSSNLIEIAEELVGEFALTHYSSAGSVAAALRTIDNNIYTGICMHLSCGIGTCAEHSAITEMLKHRETVISEIVAISSSGILPPCGRCRELMSQVSKDNRETMVVISETESVSLNELLPIHWLDGDASTR